VTVTQWLQSVLTYKWRLIMNDSLSDYLLCVDLQCGHLQWWNHVRTDVSRRNDNNIVVLVLRYVTFCLQYWTSRWLVFAFFVESEMKLSVWNCKVSARSYSGRRSRLTKCVFARYQYYVGTHWHVGCCNLAHWFICRIVFTVYTVHCCKFLTDGRVWSVHVLFCHLLAVGTFIN